MQTFQYWNNSIPTWNSGVKNYLHTFIVTNATDCPILLSYGATFRMGVLLPDYPEENVVKGENVPNFSKVNTGTSHGTSDDMSNVFQILLDLQQKQRAIQYQYNSNMVPTTNTAQTETPFRTTTPSIKQVDPVHVHINTSWSGPPAHCAHVQAGLQTRGIISLEKSQAPTQ